MKKVLIIVVVFASLVSSVLAVPLTLLNPGFEAGIIGPWFFVSGAPASYGGSYARTGSYGVLLGTNYSRYCQGVTAPAPGFYAFRGWAKQTIGDLNAHLEIFTDDGSFSGADRLDYEYFGVATTDWQQAELMIHHDGGPLLVCFSNVERSAQYDDFTWDVNYDPTAVPTSTATPTITSTSAPTATPTQVLVTPTDTPTPDSSIEEMTAIIVEQNRVGTLWSIFGGVIVVVLLGLLFFRIGR